MKDLLQRILDSLFRAGGKRTPQEQAEFLRELRPAAQQLWHAYQQQHGIHADAKYAESAVQAIYMLRYFPAYTQLIRERLAFALECGFIPLDAETIEAAYFGAGPGPEVYGTLQFLQESVPTARRCIAHLFDIGDKTWAPSRAVNVDELVPLVWSRDALQIASSRFDIATQPILSVKEHRALVSCHLVVFQNCLNEIPADRYGFVRDNLLEILRLMPAKSVLLIIERTKYPGVTGLLAELNALAAKGGMRDVMISDEDVYNARHIKDSMPAVVMENLFLRQTRVYGQYADDEVGLVLAPKVEYLWTLFRRS